MLVAACLLTSAESTRKLKPLSDDPLPLPLALKCQSFESRRQSCRSAFSTAGAGRALFSSAGLPSG